MTRKYIFAAALAGLLTMGGVAWAHAHSLPGNPSAAQQADKSAKSASGKVVSIGETGTSFSVEVSDAGGKHNMDFVLDKSTKVQGRVKIGTVVTVEYTLADSGQNVALTITAQA
jgi:hypothetical protein